MPKLPQMSTCKCRMRVSWEHFAVAEDALGTIRKKLGDLGADPGWQPWLSLSCLLAPVADTSTFHPEPVGWQSQRQRGHILSL